MEIRVEKSVIINWAWDRELGCLDGGRKGAKACFIQRNIEHLFQKVVLGMCGLFGEG